MLSYEIWLTITLVAVTFAALYPEDTRNLLALAGLAPSVLRLWLSQRLLMLRLGPRLALDNYLMMRRVRRIRRRHNRVETTNEETNT